MKIPYIKIKQRGEVFFSSKFKASLLLDHIDFHYREPYEEYQNNDIQIKNEQYIESIRKKGIELSSNSEGIQRRLQFNRINSIAKFIKESESNFLPNTILLSADISKIPDFENTYLMYEENDFGFLEFPNNFKFSIIDGQHRLAGLSLIEKDLLEEFEIPAIILLNVSKPTAAKLFADINGKQKAVNKSLIYDLYSEINDDEFRDIKKYHTICENFYISPESPLFRQIKMLGIGSGAISQAFFIDYTKDTLKKANLDNLSVQEVYNELFMYFKAYQKIFPNDWPVPEKYNNTKEIQLHSDFVLKERKSQLVKTNGFGAILRAFPIFFDKSQGNFQEYLKNVGLLKGKIDWVASETTGTGKAFQNKIYDDIKELIITKHNK